jgi:ABC-type antimicrobial peptide transport system permease subunit
MIVNLKDTTKLIAISVMIACGVFVATLFLSYNMDIVNIKDQIVNEQVQVFYDAQVRTSIVISSVSGGCLLLTSFVMIIFYIKNYIDTHKKELGILKALGYPNMRIALDFWLFGLSTLFGALIGYLGAHIIIPSFYITQNKDNIIPEVTFNFHPLLLVCLIVLPTLLFSLIAILYANHSLKRPTLDLLEDKLYISKKERKYKEKNNDNSYLKELKKVTLRKKTLAFFIIFSSFCFSAMTQMSSSMKDLASSLMGVMVLIIGLLLACTTLILAIITVINGNKKNIAMMKVFGYSQKECSKSIIDIYRPLSYIGFIIGTFYQYGLLRIMIDIVFKDFEGVPEYKFDIPMMFVSLVCFIVFYELVMYIYSRKIKNISIKEVMLEP